MPVRLESSTIASDDSRIGPPRGRYRRLGAFLVPTLTVVGLLYQGLAGLGIALLQRDVIVVAGACLAVGCVAGLIAAFGSESIRVVILSATTVLLLDMTVYPSRLFEALTPLHRLAPERDERRVADLHRIQDALEHYIQDVGPLPPPSEYGEGTGPQTFWADWWDLSSMDLDGDGRYFLDFLEDGGGLEVPLDPRNIAPQPDDPRSGHQYAYLLVPPGYEYQGGACGAWRNQWVYMLAIANFETAGPRTTELKARSGCECLWGESPDFFAKHFDYVLCGSFPMSETGSSAPSDPS